MACQKEEKEIIITPIFDESLRGFLLEHKITIKNVNSILNSNDGIGLSYYKYGNVSNFNMQAVITSFQTQLTGGCIFTLPGTRKDGKSCIIWSKYSSEEIRRIVKMKAFL